MYLASFSFFLLRLQMFVGAFLAAIGLFIPIWIWLQYGTGRYAIYDQFGSVVGKANYLLIGIGMGLFFIAMGVLIFKVAQKELAHRRSQTKQ